MTMMAGAFSGGADAQTTPNWDALVDRFFDAYFHFNPSAATSAGFHEYDDRLEDLSAASTRNYIAAMRGFEAGFAAFPGAKLTPVQSADRDLVLSTIRAGLLDVETIRDQERNPDEYTSIATNSVFVVMSRSFAPPGPA